MSILSVLTGPPPPVKPFNGGILKIPLFLVISGTHTRIHFAIPDIGKM
jgi:hypothetical protein